MLKITNQGMYNNGFKNGSMEYRNGSNSGEKNDLPKTTRSEHKKFSFDKSELKALRNHKKSLDYAEQEEKDVEIKVYYEGKK